MEMKEKKKIQVDTKFLSIISRNLKLIVDKTNIIIYYSNQYAYANDLIINEELRYRKEVAKILKIDIYNDED